MSSRKLTSRQQRFVEEYLVDLNATQAAVRAGYSAKTAQVQASRLLSKAIVADEIKRRSIKRAERTGLTAEKVLLELGRVGLSDVRKLFAADGSVLPPEQWDDDTAAAVASIEVTSRPGALDEDGNRMVEHVHKVRLWDKNSALEKIGKHLQMFVERQEVRLTISHEDALDDLE